MPSNTLPDDTTWMLRRISENPNDPTWLVHHSADAPNRPNTATYSERPIDGCPVFMDANIREAYYAALYRRYIYKGPCVLVQVIKDPVAGWLPTGRVRRRSYLPKGADKVLSKWRKKPPNPYTLKQAELPIPTPLVSAPTPRVFDTLSSLPRRLDFIKESDPGTSGSWMRQLSDIYAMSERYEAARSAIDDQLAVLDGATREALAHYEAFTAMVTAGVPGCVIRLGTGAPVAPTYAQPVDIKLPTV